MFWFTVQALVSRLKVVVVISRLPQKKTWKKLGELTPLDAWFAASRLSQIWSRNAKAIS